MTEEEKQAFLQAFLEKTYHTFRELECFADLIKDLDSE